MLNDNNNKVWNDKNEDTLIFMHGKRKSHILGTIHGTTYTTTTIPTTEYRTTVTDQNTSHVNMGIFSKPALPVVKTRLINDKYVSMRQQYYYFEIYSY